MKMDPATGQNRAFFERLHIDLPLLLALLVVMGFGLVVMYSAGGQSLAMMERQAMRMVMALLVMVGLAQLSPRSYERLAPLLFFLWCDIVAGGTLFWRILQRSTTLAQSRLHPFSAVRTAETGCTTNGGTIYWSTTYSSRFNDPSRRINDGLFPSNIDRQTA